MKAHAGRSSFRSNARSAELMRWRTRWRKRKSPPRSIRSRAISTSLAKFYVEKDIDIGHFVGHKVQVIPGIIDTRTIITFKAF